jgi:hypothetical protein
MRPVSTLTRERERAARGPLIPPWAVIGVVLVGVVVALYVIGSNTGSKSPPNAGLRTRTTTHHAAATSHQVPSVVAAKPTSVKLQLVPTGTVYVCLVDGTGKMLIPGQIFSAGQTIPTKTASKMLLTLGNNAIQMKVNGVPVAVDPSSTSIGFTLDPSGHHPLPPAQQPRCE